MKFCEELYASHGDVIIARRRSVIAPMLITVAGAALLVLNALLPDDAELVNLRSVLVLAGAVAAIVGIVMLSARMFGSGVPYHKGCRSYLRGEVLMFDESRRRQAMPARCSPSRDATYRRYRCFSTRHPTAVSSRCSRSSMSIWSTARWVILK